ncbi:hypothetical protein FF38_02571 [Lucilia cuprina]|uniref:Uncharacterized protein n=1 Tax=Lucilia cuprina TaxID=7375 RepID=A0A0L0BYZ7_LUCCU|nr:hypothetical protein FF38_02571 [Lucilia cuprina]
MDCDCVVEYCWWFVDVVAAAVVVAAVLHHDDDHSNDDDYVKNLVYCPHCRERVNQGVDLRDGYHDRDDICCCRSEPKGLKGFRFDHLPEPRTLVLGLLQVRIAKTVTCNLHLWSLLLNVWFPVEKLVMGEKIIYERQALKGNKQIYPRSGIIVNNFRFGMQQQQQQVKCCSLKLLFTKFKDTSNTKEIHTYTQRTLNCKPCWRLYVLIKLGDNEY